MMDVYIMFRHFSSPFSFFISSGIFSNLSALDLCPGLKQLHGLNLSNIATYHIVNIVSTLCQITQTYPERLMLLLQAVRSTLLI
jgi:hypothetical protein